ncbi:formimidoylglutamase [Elizabethkingia sp. JS20170427COW]|uniref:formimidoylglutamase n=1 Tax=Elizabethkingia sp. JS20170427COW TaxID=2583851 RepID=UPI00111042F7|nr:formimidoylglutamase [Elizabethkingia sp. JS20170427COW]QCX53299.1 formimidoylglutamase [Elizabethkingia sp. JS20170427COW]
MDLEHLLIPAPSIKTENWQLGKTIKNEIVDGGIALIFCSDERGAGGDAFPKNFTEVRKQLYALSRQDWEISVADLGNFISGSTVEDTHFALQELLTYCLKRHVVPVVIGGSCELSYSVFKAVNYLYKGLNYVQISNVIHLENTKDIIHEKNFLSRILTEKDNPIRQYHHLGFQKHLNEYDAIQLMKDVDFDIVRLADMMGSPERMEPYFRNADVVTLNCDAVESFTEAFSLHPQVNGLNRREVCRYSKEIGLSTNLKSVGIFNFQPKSRSLFNHQLLAQMIWYFLEGVNIQRSHPKERAFETYVVMIGEHEVYFKRDTFSDLWYYGKEDEIDKCLPCSKWDYEQAKLGVLNHRLLRFEV